MKRPHESTCCTTLPREPDRRKARLFRARRNRHGILRDIKTATLQAAADVCRAPRTGDGQQATLLQGLVRGCKPAAVINPWTILRIRRRCIEMQQNRMQHAGMSRQPRWSAIVFKHHSRVMKQRAVRQMLAMPIRHHSQRLGNNQRAALLLELGRCRRQCMTQAKASKPDLRLARRAKWRTGQPGHFLRHLARRRAANLLALNDQ